MANALSGVRVLDLTHYVAGPYCTKLLADYGADVIKVEKPGLGDPARSIGPFFHDTPGLEKSGLFLFLNTSKKSINLNLKSKDGAQILKQLVKDVDIVVENFHPRVLPALGLDYEALKDCNPSLVMTSITNFGQSGPYKNYTMDAIVADGMGGWSITVGEPERPPLKIGGYQAEFTAGLQAAMATMTALTYQELHGPGQHVDVSILESVVNMLMSDTILYAYTGQVKIREGVRHRPYPSTVLPCRDGYVGVIGHMPIQWETLCAWMEKPELMDDPRFGTSGLRREHADDLDEILTSWLADKTQDELYHVAQELRIPFGKVMNAEQILHHTQLIHRNYFMSIDHPATGEVKYPGAPFRFKDLPYDIQRAPLLGEHNEEIYGRRLGYRPEEVVRLRELGVI